LARERNPTAPVTAFSFRARRPIFDGTPFIVGGEPWADGSGAELWVADTGGQVATIGQVEFDPG
jgi:3-methylfumaryl-CoA hydratase